jgi:hypothetical protein
VPTKTVLKVGFLERDFERDYLAEKTNQTKMGPKITLCLLHANNEIILSFSGFLLWCLKQLLEFMVLN